MTLTPTDLQILYAQLGNRITTLRKNKKNKLIEKQAEVSRQIKGLEYRRGIIEEDLVMIAVNYTNTRIEEISKVMKDQQSKIEIVK